LRLFEENLSRYRKDEELQGVVDLGAGY